MRSVLDCALLWKVTEQYLDTEAGQLIPALIIDRVMSAFHDLGKRNQLPINVNPMNWTNIVVSGVDAKFHVFKVLDEDDIRPSKGGADTRDVCQEHGVANAEFRFAISEVAHLSRENRNMREELKRHGVCHLALITVLCKALQRLTNQPGQHMVPLLGDETDGAAAEASGAPAKLCSRPKFLDKLWMEWMVGMCSNKKAECFSSTKRGKVKTKYST